LIADYKIGLPHTRDVQVSTVGDQLDKIKETFEKVPIAVMLGDGIQSAMDDVIGAS
jgi:hypothetical protein